MLNLKLKLSTIVIAKIKNFVVKHPIVAVIFLVVLAGVLSMYGFFSGEYLFYFTGLADDTCCLQMVSQMQSERYASEGVWPVYTFTAGMGDALSSGSINVEPISYVMSWIRRIVNAFMPYDAGTQSVENFYFQFITSFLGTALFTFLWLRTLNVCKYASTIGSLLVAFSGCIVVLSIWRIESFGFSMAFYLFAFEQLHGCLEVDTDVQIEGMTRGLQVVFVLLSNVGNTKLVAHFDIEFVVLGTTAHLDAHVATLEVLV